MTGVKKPIYIASEDSMLHQSYRVIKTDNGKVLGILTQNTHKLKVRMI